jgi:hypothetical protein
LSFPFQCCETFLFQSVLVLMSRRNFWAVGPLYTHKMRLDLFPWFYSSGYPMTDK